MANLLSIKRYIDDGGGLHLGIKEQFLSWLAEVNRRIGILGLHIDESNYQENSCFINLLDIQYCFDTDGELQTDLYTKETDSRSFLNFSSAHPNHTFSGNVFSQSLRLRRIINSDERLKNRLDELAESFKTAGYPSKMVTGICRKVQSSARDISVKQPEEKLDDGQIIVVSTHGADSNIISAVKNSEENLRKTQSFRTQRGPLFKFVKKVGPSIRSQVNSVKKQALGIRKDCARQCNGRRCKMCRMIIKKPYVTVRGRKIFLTTGSCKSYNLCYLALCKICAKPYTGRTTNQLNSRGNGHRNLYKEILKKAEENKLDEIDKSNDLYTLGLHLHLDHGLTDPNAFDDNISFGILEVVNPVDIEQKEFQWMHKLNTFYPLGLNVEYPFGIPHLGQN